MSDLFSAREKVEKGAEWRGSINVDIGGDVMNLTVRQLVDPEQWEVMSKVDTDELEALQEQLPEDKMERLEELQEADTLSEAEEDELETIQTDIEEEEIDIFDTLSYETYSGLKTAAEYGVEPDQSDIQTVIANNADELEDTYGSMTENAAREFIQDRDIQPLVEKSTNFASFTIGVKVLGETLGDSKN